MKVTYETTIFCKSDTTATSVSLTNREMGIQRHYFLSARVKPSAIATKLRLTRWS